MHLKETLICRHNVLNQSLNLVGVIAIEATELPEILLSKLENLVYDYIKEKYYSRINDFGISSVDVKVYYTVSEHCGR